MFLSYSSTYSFNSTIIIYWTDIVLGNENKIKQKKDIPYLHGVYSQVGKTDIHQIITQINVIRSLTALIGGWYQSGKTKKNEWKSTYWSRVVGDAQDVRPHQLYM